jgi:hypothetical protein
VPRNGDSAVPTRIAQDVLDGVGTARAFEFLQSTSLGPRTPLPTLQ